MFTPDVGGELNKVVHFYAYESMGAREAARAAAAANADWAAYVDAGRHHLQKQACARAARGRRAGGLFGSCLASKQGCPAAVAAARTGPG